MRFLKLKLSLCAPETAYAEIKYYKNVISFDCLLNVILL